MVGYGQIPSNTNSSREKEEKEVQNKAEKYLNRLKEKYKTITWTLWKFSF